MIRPMRENAVKCSVASIKEGSDLHSASSQKEGVDACLHVFMPGAERRTIRNVRPLSLLIAVPHIQEGGSGAILEETNQEW